MLFSRKLTYVVLGLVTLQFLCFLIGAVVSPTPNSSMQYLATKCVDLKGGQDEDAWFYPRGKGNFPHIRLYDFRFKMLMAISRGLSSVCKTVGNYAQLKNSLIS